MPELSRHLRTSLTDAFAADWARQRRTAEEILRRLQVQEGVVLADQVGMGKTYTALAVAVSQILARPRLDQVVVFVPARVGSKWINEWSKFSEALLEDGAPGIRCVPAAIRSGEDFLKALDDRPSTRYHVVVVTHEALTANLKDSFIQLALVQYATRHRHGAAQRRHLVAKWSTGRRGLIRDSRFSPDRVSALLAAPTSTWRTVWHRLTGEELEDDPVPAQLEDIRGDLDLDRLWAVLVELPTHRSKHVERYLESARQELSNATQLVWKKVLVTARLKLPLLIVDEAHALKNDHTRISRLFSRSEDRQEDGAFVGIFERMLFLTATPFELGHAELVRVLGRFTAVVPRHPQPAVSLTERLERLKKALGGAQETAVTFDRRWGALSSEDAMTLKCWGTDVAPDPAMPPRVERAWRDAVFAVQARRAMHEELRPWIIRHQRPNRRSYRPGRAILPNVDELPGGEGLPIPDNSILPFLLAARAHALALQSASSPRPMFAYGIASSFETYLRLGAADDRDSDEEGFTAGAGIEAWSRDLDRVDPAAWYHQEIQRLLGDEHRRHRHPKISATADRAADLWLSGEKCLIFCWYIRTSAALLEAVTWRIEQVTRSRAADALGVAAWAVDQELERMANRLFRSDTGNYRRLRTFLREAFGEAATDDAPLADALAGLAIRHLRTPAFLVRYVRLTPDLTIEKIMTGITGDNPPAVNLLQRWVDFAARASAMTRAERDLNLERLLGEHPEPEGEEHSPQGRGASLAQVRRAYGGTRREDRERLISVFNTPFAPDVLVASSVMGEGIDLHQECRHVIHHDLDWNPSKLEQRTGRLDRIGALAERVGASIEVFEPYLAGTHDEKMFRVVKDRAGWFDIVMGRPTGDDEQQTDLEEARAQLPDVIREALSMDLSLEDPHM